MQKSTLEALWLYLVRFYGFLLRPGRSEEEAGLFQKI
jgi:hypothetical protein